MENFNFYNKFVFIFIINSYIYILIFEYLIFHVPINEGKCKEKSMLIAIIIFLFFIIF